MVEHHHDTPFHNSHSEEHDSVSTEAFMARFAQYIQPSETARDRLRELHEKGKSEEFEELAEELVEEALLEHEEYLKNALEIKRVRSASRPNPELEKELTERQKAIRAEHQQILFNIAGVPTDAGLNDFEVSKHNIEHRIQDFLEHGGEASHLLEELGILTINEDGKEVFNYPRGLFPAETDQKWDIYIDQVIRHKQAQDDEKNERISREERAEMDKQRKIAHDAIAADVHKLLQLDTLPENSTWGFRKTRVLVGKMRDGTFPTMETAEKAVTTERVVEASRVLGVLGMRMIDLNIDQKK